MRPVLFGEILFDRFPDGKDVLGGAPFNVAWNLRQLRENPLLLAGIGDDELGEQITRRMAEVGLDLTGLQTLTAYPTGQVEVSLVDGEPSYSIRSEQAYDYLAEATALQVLPEEPWLLYHGSLALRTQGNARLCTALCERAAVRFVDVNLRTPWFDRVQILEVLSGAEYVKVNQQELQELTGIHDVAASVRWLFDQVGIRHSVWVTAGSSGASLYLRSGESWSAPAPAVPVLIDAVGAGDAFSSIVLLGILQDWQPRVMLSKALDFAAQVCTLRGATTDSTDFYKQWYEDAS